MSYPFIMDYEEATYYATPTFKLKQGDDLISQQYHLLLKPGIRRNSIDLDCKID